MKISRYLISGFLLAFTMVGVLQAGYSTRYTITKVAGAAGLTGSTDGTGTVALFYEPRGIALDAAGNLYLADTYNHTIRKVTTGGVVTTLAGMAGVADYADGTGSAARFYFPAALVVDSSGNVFVADTDNHVIRKITPAGVVTTVAGTAASVGSADGTGSAARFNMPSGVTLDGVGNLYIADTYNNTIRKMTPTGVVSTVAGSAGLYGPVDGTGSAARFNGPWGLAMSAAGDVYVADSYNHAIRKMTPAGVVTTVAGVLGSQGGVDGPVNTAKFMYPHSVAVDGLGNIYVADTNNVVIRRISAGLVTTLAGLQNSSSQNDGTGAYARFNFPYGVTADASGRIYVTDHSTLRTGVAVIEGDLNANGSGDIVLSNPTSGQRAVWFMNGTSISAGSMLGVLPTDWVISAMADFNGDGKADLLLSNSATGERAIWLMNGSTILAGATLGILSLDWSFVGTGDFEGYSRADIVLWNRVTGERAIWMMNGTTLTRGSSLGIISPAWASTAVGDFDGDGQADLLLTNTSTGERAVWLMRDATILAGVVLGTLDPNWVIRGVGDFNADGRKDVLLSNVVTGERAIWLMNGAAIGSGVSLGVLSTDWEISRVADFNGDGKADIFLTHLPTGERAVWLMNGTTISAGVSLGVVAPNWLITN